MEYSSIVWQGNEALRPLLTAIDLIDEDPDNENYHTEPSVKRLAVMLSKHGQQEPLVIFPKDGRMVLKAGHKRTRAAKSLSWTHLACVVYDGSEEMAAAFRIGSNRSAQDSKLSPELVALHAVKLQDALGGLEQTATVMAFETADLSALVAKLGQTSQTEATAETTAAGERGRSNKATIAYNLVFESEGQQKIWYGFLRQLKGLYPELDTAAARVCRFIQDEARGLAPSVQAGPPALGGHGRETYTLGFEDPKDFATFVNVVHQLRQVYGASEPGGDGFRVLDYLRSKDTGGPSEQSEETNQKA